MNDDANSDDSGRPEGSADPNPPVRKDAVSPSKSSASLVGSRLGDYQVLRKLGRGGMADVYAARHLSLGRDVALKVLRSDYARDKDYVERFRREARAAAKLNHPNIVQVFDVGSSNNYHFIAQELIDGENLREALDRQGAMSPDEATRVLVDVASALEVAAEAGITHRDIKPENIMRSSRGALKVADFGLARLGGGAEGSHANLTQAGLTLGTPRYMSPEQIQGLVADARSDLYSLGVTMYHLLAGRPPFEADDPLALAVMHLHETPKPLDRARNRRDQDGNPDVPEWLIAVISRMLSKSPGDRFQSPSELLDAVRNEASSSTLPGFGIGTAAATIRLQRAADQARSVRTRKRLKLAIAILAPLICWGAAWAVLKQQPAKDLVSLLRPGVVPKGDSVQEQYFIAVNRNDEAGWESIGELFPPQDSSTHADYFAKSQIQLARLLVSQEMPLKAENVLKALLKDPQVNPAYRVLALVERCRLLEQQGADTDLDAAKQQLQAMVADVKTSSPTSLRLIQRVLPEAEQAHWEISSLGS
ncbi:serine/threonine-protein kinase [Rubripirellula lacrimiformis]|nr:serine/threonine-protein kinase [Rubripirellula lacrimiformis]